MSSAQERPTGSAGTETTGSTEQTGTGVPGQRAGAHRSTGYQEGHRESAEYEYGRGDMASFGGATLAAVLMIFTGLIGFFQGIVGLIHGAFYTVHPNYVFAVGPWGRGLTQLILGAVVFAAGACLLLGMTWARAVGIVLAVLYGIASFMFLPWYPFWSIILIALNVFIIWALATMGRHRVA
jgi:hypothetical protein